MTLLTRRALVLVPSAVALVLLGCSGNEAAPNPVSLPPDATAEAQTDAAKEASAATDAMDESEAATDDASDTDAEAGSDDASSGDEDDGSLDASDDGG